MLANGSAFAQSASDSASKNAPITPSASDPGSVRSGADIAANNNFRLEGFRSAHFGMNEQAVRAAAAKDFGVKPEALTSTINRGERTQSLSITVPNLLQDGGTASVTYVLGYNSKSLIQVSLLWSKATDPKLTTEKLIENADVLRSSFRSKGYLPETIVTDAPTANGAVLFRGADATGRTAALILEGRASVDKERKVFTPTALLVLYVADPKKPDVFSLPPDQF